MQDIQFDKQDTLDHIISEIGIDNVTYMLFTKPKNHSEYGKITGRRILVKKGAVIQFEKQKNNQAFHENIQPENAVSKLKELLADNFGGLLLRTGDSEYELRINGDDTAEIKKTKTFSSDTDENDFSHNKEKKYLIKEGMTVEPLIDLGIFSKDGRIINSKYDKFRQINRFLEIVDDALKYLPSDKINIVDFGCGKSYLTFVVYYFLEKVRGCKVNIIGLDLKADVISGCNKTAQKYGYGNLKFESGKIETFIPPWDIDMVISLHACDTATDDVLLSAVKNNARVILAVPCCQHELNTQISSADYAILTRYGVIKERAAALFTDAIRANLLESAGYKTQMLEFVDLNHTPKNILIRAVKSNIPEHIKKKSLADVRNLAETFNLSPKLLTMLFP
jgi:hypothetical protein